MKIRIEPYKTWSGGAKALGERAGILRATRKQVEKHGDFSHVINWGRSQRRFRGEYINAPEAVSVASNKLLAAKAFDEAKVPQAPFTESREEATRWIREDGKTVVCRTLLRANSGRGIVLAAPGMEGDIPAAPLYVEYIKKADEYRVHVFGGKIIDVQQKKKRLDFPEDKVNFQIRNAQFGWVFCREDVNPPQAVKDAAISAVAALGLDFGAVDIGWNQHKELAVVYEVNTAPGLEGTTLDNYFNALLEQFPALRGGMYNRRREGRV